jgi:hypothetical protein
MNRIQHVDLALRLAVFDGVLAPKFLLRLLFVAAIDAATGKILPGRLE